MYFISSLADHICLNIVCIFPLVEHLSVSSFICDVLYNDSLIGSFYTGAEKMEECGLKKTVSGRVVEGRI